MTVDTDICQRKSIRLAEYDYSKAGAYFVTICTHERKCLFGEIADEKMILSWIGRIAESCWQEIPRHFEHVDLDYYVIMPNHLHGILIIEDDRRGTACLPLRMIRQRTNDSENHKRVQFQPLFDHSNRPSPNKSTNCEIPRVFPSGNAVFSTVSSAMTMN